MFDFNPVPLIDTFLGFKAQIEINRKACETDFARQVHDMTLSKIEQVLADLRHDVAFQAEIDAERGTPEGDALWEIMNEGSWFFQAAWLDKGPVSVIDHVWIYADGSVDAYRRSLRGYGLVPAASLEGLQDIFRTIRRETGVRFIAAYRSVKDDIWEA
ncbi:MAG: hypothetical protein M9955_05570 [Rhizobiaceae bacterium]|nr:hypothetical protein [Rhizobiaceae bacterium]